MSRPAARASRPSRSCSAATSLHPAHQSSQDASPPVIRSKSPVVTPFVVNRAAQCEIAVANRSSIDPPGTRWPDTANECILSGTGTVNSLRVMIPAGRVPGEGPVLPPGGGGEGDTMEQHELHMTLNGASRALPCDPDAPLLDVLRHGAGLAGPRFGCGTGLCGACFVLVDGQAAQCGYCISGMVVSAAALLRGNPSPSEQEVREALEPNLCRCGTHGRIVGAVMKAAGGAAGRAAR